MCNKTHLHARARNCVQVKSTCVGNPSIRVSEPNEGKILKYNLKINIKFPCVGNSNENVPYQIILIKYYNCILINILDWI